MKKSPAICPICFNKLRTINKKRKLPSFSTSLIEKACLHDVIGHYYQSLSHNDKPFIIYICLREYDHILTEFNFIDNKTIFHCNDDEFEIEKIVQLDFPDLTKFKEKLLLYSTLS